MANTAIDLQSTSTPSTWDAFAVNLKDLTKSLPAKPPRKTGSSKKSPTKSPEIVESTEASSETTKPEISDEQKVFGFDVRDNLLLKANDGAVSGIEGIVDSKEDRQREDNKKQAIYRLANSTAISIAQFTKIENFVDSKIDSLTNKIEVTNVQIEQTEQKIEDTNTELDDQQQIVDDSSAQLQSDLGDEEVGNSKWDTLIAEEEKLKQDLQEATASGDTEEIDRINQALEANKIQQHEAESSLIDNIDAVDSSEVNLAAQEEILDSIKNKLDDLKDDLSQLNSDKDKYTQECEQYENFRDKINDPEFREKLDAGELTVQDLRDAGAPQDVINKLEGQELNSTNVLTETSNSVQDLQGNITIALAEQNNTTQFASNKTTTFTAASLDGEGIQTEDFELKVAYKLAGETPEAIPAPEVAPITPSFAITVPVA